MRMTQFLFVTILATHSFVPRTGWSDEVQPVDFIVNSQVVSDEVTGGSESYSGNSIVSNDGSCPEGSACANGSGSAGDGSISEGSGSGGLGNGGLRGHLASTAAYVGDLRHGVYANDRTGGCVPRTYGYPDLFYNYYTQGNCNATNAQMYLAPVPVPPNVGHTFYTYQPFMPQEMLYWHKDRFHNYYDGGRGMNHTKVHYFAPPVRQAASNLYWNHIRIPR